MTGAFAMQRLPGFPIDSISEEARDWTVMRRLAWQIAFDVIDKAPAWATGRSNRHARNCGKAADAPRVIPCAGNPRNPVRSG
jgi:hypothetical protein